MPSGDNAVFRPGQSPRHLLVVGGGIMGLWGAVKACQAGFSVTLIERDTIGSGASGGLMGAMFPWMPDRWDDKKQFQFEALTSLPAELAALEAATGLSACYRRAGRIIPLPKPHLKAIALRHQADAERNWQQGEHRFAWQVSDMPVVASYLASEFGAGGYVHDTLAARAEPRALVALLKAWLAMQPNVKLIEGAGLVALDANAGRAQIVTTHPALSLRDFSPTGGESGTRGSIVPQAALPPCGGDVGEADGGGYPATRLELSFTHAFLAAGVDSFPVLETLLPPLAAPLGQGVKGQAALLKADLDPSLPVAFLDGIYIVPHENGHVAIGSTSENTYADPASTDHLLDAVLEKARALVPALATAPVIERWAGLRPKAIGRDPLIGPVPGHTNVLALTGGFKISFGMAHQLAAAAVDYALGREPAGLPDNFTVAGQVAGLAGRSQKMNCDS
jgi:glycine oxidase